MLTAQGQLQDVTGIEQPGVFWDASQSNAIPESCHLKWKIEMLTTQDQLQNSTRIEQLAVFCDASQKIELLESFQAHEEPPLMSSPFI